jgi:DNA-binding IclR family transcriptional regulator
MQTAVSFDRASDDAVSLPAPTVAKTMAVLEALGGSVTGLTQAEVVQQTGCSVNLVFRVLATLVALGYVLSGRLLESMQIPLYSFAPGKAILAWLSREDVAEWLAGIHLKAFTKRTPTTAAALEADRATVRGRGYAIDREEGLLGIRCVAAPILDTWSQPIAAITVMAPAKRLPQKRMPEVGRWCIAAAARITREWQA